MIREERQKQSKIYTVSGLTTEIKSLLEDTYPFVWIQGEISNLSRPSSGHVYLTLKDARSQISAVVFRNLAHHLKFQLENGLEITGMARLTLYEPRGTYQLVFEFIEPKGAGVLQIAFEQLKSRLAQEGLFDEKNKKKLPSLPDRISVITSPGGAVIHDIITVIGRRFPSMALEIVPVKVQGDQAAHEIREALAMVNERGTSDLVIIARGGGSLEDLAPFNSEMVARAVFASTLPVVSAVGHETDYTICDFVSDLRAPTPSVAAELVVPVKKNLVDHVEALESSLINRITFTMDQKRRQLHRLSEKLVDPRRRIIDYRLKVDDYTQRLSRTMNQLLAIKKSHLAWKVEKLFLFDPRKKNDEQKKRLNRLRTDLVRHMRALIHKKRGFSIEVMTKIEALNPLAILQRGYSVTRTIPGGKVLTDAGQVTQGQELEIILAEGSLRAGVKGVMKNGEKKF